MSLDLTLYRTFIEGCERRASAGVDSMVREFMAEFPDATPDEVRAFTVFSIETWLSIYGDAAADRALEMFDEVCEREGIDATSRYYDVIDRTRMADMVGKAKERHLEDGGWDVESYLARCRELMGSYVHRSAWDNTIRNCEANHVRWARVPTGTETCEWCLMLASRGFDYLSSDTARAGCHDDCDCVVVPGRRGTSIEGYDPGAYLDAYERTQHLAAEGYSQSQVRRLMAGEDPKAVGEPAKGRIGRPHGTEAKS